MMSGLPLRRFAEGVAGAGLSGTAATYPMPLSLDLTYSTPPLDCPQEGDVTAGDLGAHAGGF
eukprot:SAG31_NODE_9170_length_1322_cov_1.426002_1_plen_61_part_10